MRFIVSQKRSSFDERLGVGNFEKRTLLPANEHRKNIQQRRILQKSNVFTDLGLGISYKTQPLHP